MSLTIKAINNGSNQPATEEELEMLFVNVHIDKSGQFDLDIMRANGICQDGTSYFRFEIVENA